MSLETQTDERWPWDIELSRGATISTEIFGQMLRVERINATTLGYQFGDEAANARLIGVSETAQCLRFVPSLGPIPLLVFPEHQLLCPAKSTARCVLSLPLHLQVGIVEESGTKKIDEIPPPTISKALYGPVDAGTICTSVHAPNGASIEDVQREAALRDWTHAPLARPVAPEMEASPEDERSLMAYTYLRTRNNTDEPLVVTKFMVPAGVVSLYQAGRLTHTNEVSMRLLSAQEAELDFMRCPVADCVPLHNLNGERTDTTPKRRHIFSHAYRSKTGLEFGF